MRRAFTLAEILIAIGILGILFLIVIFTIQPARALEAAKDAKRHYYAKNLTNAVQQYVIDRSTPPSGIPNGTENAKPICRLHAPDTSNCVVFDQLVDEGYIATLPYDPAEIDPNLTGYRVYVENSYYHVDPVYLHTLIADNAGRAEFCGDSHVNNNGTEQCDDGNTVSGDGCTNLCVTEFCGDGIDNNGSAEQCDDANQSQTDACKNDCTTNVCGDSFRNPATEQCDDGNTVSGDGCTNLCVTEPFFFVDGNGDSGVNKDVTQNAGWTPQFVELNSKLYAIWPETNASGNGQIRVAVYNGNDATPVWTFVDGNGTNGINKNALMYAQDPQLTVFGGKLYATWREMNSSSVLQIRVAVYNGNDATPVWTFVDGNGKNGINKNTGRAAHEPQLTVLGSKLYATWLEVNGSFVDQVRVRVYNGNDAAPTWTFVDGNGANGINKSTARFAFAPQLGVANGKLYAAWHEWNASNLGQIRIRVYNGNDAAPVWKFVDGNGTNGINKVVTKDAQSPQLTVSNAKLYITWNERNASNIYQIRTGLYNGNDAAPTWTFVDGNGANGINKNTANDARHPQLTDVNGQLYAIWSETNPSAGQIRISLYNSNDAAPAWSFIDGNGVNGINKNVTKYGDYPQLMISHNILYVIWQEPNGSQAVEQIRVARKNDSP